MTDRQNEKVKSVCYLISNGMIHADKDITYIKEKETFIVWKCLEDYDGLKDEIVKSYYVDYSFTKNEVIKKSTSIFKLIEVGDLLLLNGCGGMAYPNGTKWISIIANEDLIKHPKSYLEGWHIIKIYKPNKRETNYRLAWSNEE